MLPYEEPTFTTGQRLRDSSNARPSGRRRSHIFYGAPAGKGHPQPLCTRNRCIIFLMFVVVTVLCLTHAFGSAQPAQQQPTQQSQQTPIRDLQTKILSVVPETDAGRTLASADEQLQINNIALAERSQRLAVAAKLAETQSELALSQANLNKLSEELEAARARIQTQEVAVASAQAAAAASAAAAAAAVTAAANAAPPPPKSESVALAVGDRPIQVPGYPPIAIASSKRYSKFYCIGGRGRLGSENDRSCRFQNLCYKPSSNSWQFWQDPAEQLVVLLDQGKIISEFPERFLNLRSMGNPSDAQWWAPSIVKSEDGIPSDAFAPRSDPARPAVNVLYHPHYPSNMGHVIGDDLFPIFNLMSSFGMLVNDAQLIISRDCGKIFKDNPKKAKQCDFFLKMLLPGLTNKEYLAATSPDFASRVRAGSSGGGADDLVCFEQLLVGNGPWGFQQSLGKAPSWWSYHAFYLNNLGINPNRTPKKQRITVSIKKGKRALANNDELVAYLKEQYPQYEVDALELTSLGGWKSELNYLLDTSILITPCGGVSMSAMFLPHNAALVIVDYFNLRKNVSFGMEERLWANLGYVRPFHYPFTIDEVEMPDGHRRDDYQEMRDWGQVRVDTERMGTIVQAAISHVDNFMVFGQQ